MRLLCCAAAVLLLLTIFVEGGSQSLFDAVLNGDINEVRYLLSKKDTDVNQKDLQTGQTPLMAACLNGEKEIFQLLVDHGADEKTSEKNGYTLVDAAAFQGRNEIMDILMKRGHPHSTIHPDGFAPAHRASWGDTQGHSLVMESLKVAGADLEIRSVPDGNTPLMTAIDQPKLNALTLGFLIGSNVNLNAKNNHGITAVMMACLLKNKQVPLVYALVQAGADLNVTDNQGRTTRDYVLKEGGLTEDLLQIREVPETKTEL